MDDQFRPVEGYPGNRVNSDGRVESCWTRRGRHCVPTDKWRPLKPINRLGYLTVNLTKGGGRKTAIRIHRLVLEAFVGPCPDGFIACHNDGIPTNNDLSNLRWDSQKANADDALRHGTRARGSRCNAKLTEDEVIEIRRLKAEGQSFGELAARFEVTTENVLAIVSRRTWRHLP